MITPSHGSGKNRKAFRQKRASCLTCEHRAEAWCSLGDDLEKLNEFKTFNVYQPGQTIFYQGNPCLGLYCVEEGTIALRKGDAHGNEVIVRLVHRGEILGSRTFFAQGQYAASAVALTECRVCFIDRAMVSHLNERHPAMSAIFLKNISQQLREAEESKLHFATFPVRARLANLLLELREHYGRIDDEGNLLIDLPLSRQDMASLIVTRPETLSRTIRELKKDNVAQFERRSVLVWDLDALLDEVESCQSC
jgi:CRP/FNR family transcriptional regulator